MTTEEKSDARIMRWVRTFQERGYSERDKRQDEDTVIAVAMLMASRGEQDHLKSILRTHMERITAAALIPKA